MSTVDQVLKGDLDPWALVRALVEASPEALALWDAEMRLVCLNEPFSALQWPSGRLTIGEEAVEPLREVLTRGLSAESSRQIEVAGKQFELTARPLTSGKQLLGVLCRCEAVPIQKRSLGLQLDERQFRAFFEQASIGIRYTNIDGVPLLVNDRMCEMLGRTRDELLDLPVNEVTHPEDLAQNLELIERLRSTGEGFQTTKRYVRPDGSSVWVSNHVSFVLDDQGVPEFVQGVSVDVTERVRAEQALAIANNVGALLSEDLDQARIVQALTDAAREATGAQHGAFFKIESHFDPSLAAVSGTTEYAPQLSAHFPDLTPTPGGVARPNGIFRGPGSLTASVLSRTGTLMGILFLSNIDGTDFTEEHEKVVATFVVQAAVALDNARLYERVRAMNSELIEARDAAFAAAKAKGEFLGNVSHEIRTPMNGVLGLTALLLQKDLPKDVRDLVEPIASSGETLLRVINDVLDLSKIEAGKLGIERSHLNLADVTQDVVALYQGHAMAKGIILVCNPLCEDAPLVQGDSVRIRQVLSNLLSNAVKFTEAGTVVLEWNWADGRATFTVTDTGVGIPSYRLDAIFESFTQADGSTQRRHGGTGLGLTISRHLVQLMGGDIRVESTLGQGSAFTVELPLPAAVGVETVPSGAGEREVAQGLRVLLAEDNLVNVLVAREMIQSFGCEVHVVDDGMQAITQATQNRYDLIFMDVQMPVCDGLEATRMIRKSESLEGRSPILIYALTANAMAEEREECLNAGMDGVVAKPFSPDDIRRVLAIVSARASVTA